jgi:hypothetical protein
MSNSTIDKLLKDTVRKVESIKHQKWLISQKQRGLLMELNKLDADLRSAVTAVAMLHQVQEKEDEVG